MNLQHLYGPVDYSSLIKARNTLQRVLANAQSEGEKMGVVKAFEFCYELSWKILKKILNFHSIEVGSARDVFREATKVRLITDPEKWLSYLDKRNITVHCYQEEILNDLFSNTAKEFLQDLDQLLDKLAQEAKNYAPNGR